MPTLYDPYGNPVPEAMLRRPVTAVPSLRRHAWQQTQALISGMTPERLAALLADPDADDDWAEFASAMEDRDPHYGSVLGVRRRAISGLDPVVEAAGEDDASAALAEEVREMLAQLDWSGLVDDALDGLSIGWSALEIRWETSASQWRPARTVWRDPIHFVWDDHDVLHHRNAAGAAGAPLEPLRWILHVPRLRTGGPRRTGLARTAAFGWLAKHYTWADWMQFIEVYGMPARLGRYGPDATEKEISRLLSAVRALGSDAAAVVPESMPVELLEAQRSGGGDGKPVFEGLMRYVDEQISKLVLGQTMTADAGSSRAQAEVHDRVRQDIREADAAQLAETLQRDLVRPFVAVNHGVQAVYPRLRIPLPQAMDRGALVEALDKLVPLGLRVGQGEIRKRLGLPDPETEDELLERPRVSPTAAASAARRLALLAAQDPAADLDAEMEAALEDWEPIMEDALGPVRTAVAQAENWEDLVERLASAELNTTEIIQSLARVTFEARGVGDAEQ